MRRIWLSKPHISAFQFKGFLSVIETPADGSIVDIGELKTGMDMFRQWNRLAEAIKAQLIDAGHFQFLPAQLNALVNIEFFYESLSLRLKFGLI